MLTRRALALVTALAAVSVAGCSSGSPTTNSSPSASASYPVTVGTLTLTAQPKRIVSLSPTATEDLFALGAGPQVIAVDSLSNFPADAPKTDLSGFKPNAEAIAAKNPDLVVISNDIDKISSQLATLKIPVFLAPAATTLDDVYQQVTQLGLLTGHVAGASALNANVKSKIDAAIKGLKPRAKPLTYYYELSQDLYSATSKTFIGSVFALAGLTNVADASDTANTGYPQLSAEGLVKANPDMIFLADTKCCGQSADTVKARAGWAGITAVSKNQIVGLDDDVASRWGPRIVDLVMAITTSVNSVPA